MRGCAAAVLAGATLVCCTALAHGPQIQITNTNSKIVTREIIPSGSTGSFLTAEKSVYVIPILQAFTGDPATSHWVVMPNSVIDPILGVSAYQFGPGLAYGYGHTFEAAQHFNVNFIDSLKRWSGLQFSPNTGPEEIGAFRGDSTTPPDMIFTTDASPFQGLELPNISPTYNAEAHSSLRYRMLGDGLSSLVEPQDGIYLLQLQIASSQNGLAASDPLYFVLYKNAEIGALSTAVQSLGVAPERVQFMPVPEPVSSALMTLGICGALLCRRRGKGRRSDET